MADLADAVARTDHAPGIDVEVLYLGGSPRSGTTLIDRMISQLPGRLSAGEVVHVWARGVRDDELCGCGERFHACPFWSEVGREAFGGWDRLDLERVLELQRRVDRNRYVLFMLFPRLSARYRRDLRTYTAILADLYRAIRSCGGATVVDSSKHPSTAFLLRRVPGVRLDVLHVVRDSRGVADSLSRKVRRPEVVGGEAFMYRRPAWRAALEWVAFNAMFHALALTRTPVARIRYEDVVAAPAAAMRRIAGPASEPAAFVDGTRVLLGVDHTVSGNPMRFARGAIELRPDERWRTSTGRGRRIVTALTAPLLLVYGYRLRPRPAPETPA
jgi:hypothetical protein